MRQIPYCRPTRIRRNSTNFGRCDYLAPEIYGAHIKVFGLELTGLSDTEIRQGSPYTGLYRPLGFQEVDAARSSRQSAHEGGKVNPTHRPSLPPRRHPWYSFLLEAESTPGPYCGRKYYVNGKFQRPLGNRPRDFSSVAQVTEPTAQQRVLG